MQTTEYYNDKLPDANLKGDGIGDKYSNMVNNFGKIKDESAVENIERGNEDQKRNTIHNIVMPRLPLWISKVMKRSNPWKDCVDYKHRLRSNRQR